MGELMTQDRAQRKALLAKLKAFSIPRVTVVGGGASLPQTAIEDRQSG